MQLCHMPERTQQRDTFSHMHVVCCEPFNNGGMHACMQQLVRTAGGIMQSVTP